MDNPFDRMDSEDIAMVLAKMVVDLVQLQLTVKDMDKREDVILQLLSEFADKIGDLTVRLEAIERFLEEDL